MTNGCVFYLAELCRQGPLHSEITRDQQAGARRSTCDTFTLSPLERNAIFVYPFFCFLHFLLKERDARRSLFQNHCMKNGSTKNYFHLRKRWSTLSLYDFKIEILFFLFVFLFL